MPLTDEQIIEQRKEAPYYCPGCGRALGYPGQCVGTAEAPHPAIQTVPTDELRGTSDEQPHGDPAQHTPAPASE